MHLTRLATASLRCLRWVLAPSATRRRILLLIVSPNLPALQYLRYALRDALARSSTRVVELFQQWDVDKSGFIDRKEFRRAVQELGFNARDKEIDIVFDEYDEDNSGELDYRELNKKMRQFAGVEVEQRHALRRISGGRYPPPTRASNRNRQR